MAGEIDLMQHYPRSKRDVSGRGVTKTEEHRAIARQYGEAFFDGSRETGYGGFRYDPRFWQPVIPDFQKHFTLTGQSKVLDIGCAKGFLLYDLTQLIPGISVSGIDISKYAIEHALPEVKNDLQVGCATKLPFDDNSFDVVFSITTLHNLEEDELAIAIQEIERVGTGKAFVTVDAYRNEIEKKRMEAWNLTAKTMMHVDDWKSWFKKVGYTGDFYWFIP